MNDRSWNCPVATFIWRLSKQLEAWDESQAEADLEDFRADFRRTLEELGLELPPERTAYKDYACFICSAIIEGNISLREGHRVLYSIWQEVNYGIGGAQIFEPFMYLEDSLSLVEEGYSPLIERFSGLDHSTYPDILRSEVRLFLDEHCKSGAEGGGGQGASGQRVACKGFGVIE